MGVYVALLRGLNVSKGNRISMRDLVPLFEEAGCERVKSYVQSGNIVFRLDEAKIAGLPDVVESWIAERFGVRTWIVLRDIQAMRATVDSNPYEDLNAPPTSVAVAFRRKQEAPVEFTFAGDLSAIPDRIEVRGNDCYLYLPNGFSGSKFPPNFFSKDLGETTTRNWRTVTKLLDMMEEIADIET